MYPVGVLASGWRCEPEAGGQGGSRQDFLRGVTGAQSQEDALVCAGVTRKSSSPSCFPPKAPLVIEPVRPILPTCRGPHAPRLLRALPLSRFLARFLVSILLVCLSLLNKVISTPGGSGQVRAGGRRGTAPLLRA